MMEEKLPKGWKYGVISDLVSKEGIFSDGDWVESKDQDPEGDVRLIQLADIGDGVFRDKSQRFLTSEKASSLRCTFLKKGDVLLARMPDPLGRTCVFPLSGKYVTVVDVAIIRPLCDSKWLMYWLNTPWMRGEMFNNASGSTRLRISRKNLGKIRFPIPTLNDQNLIVAKLDALFGHLDVLREKLDRIPELLKNFRQQVLTQAVTGGIKNKEYELRPLGYFAIKIQTGPFGSALHKSEYVLKGIPVINPSHIKNGEIIPDHRVSIDNVKFSELKRWKLDDGDVIIGRRGEMGRAARYFNESGEMICGTGSLLFKKSKEINPDFLSIYLRSPFTVDFLQKNSVGSTMINLNQKIIKSLPFPNISRAEQVEIVDHVNRLFHISERIESQYQLLKDKIDQLPQAILNKAFRGELVEKEVKEYVREVGEVMMAAELGREE
jgi:type I restriction enzyme S subunit